MVFQPKRISVRPATSLEGEGFVVWVYHRKVQIQRVFDNSWTVEAAISESVFNWYTAYNKVA